MEQNGVDETPVAEDEDEDENAVATHSPEEQRRTLWRTAWGVVLAASGAFSLGYAMSRAADVSVGASRPPVWPLFISLPVVALSLWFVLAPTLHQWPFETRDDHPGAGENPEPLLVELTDQPEK